MSSTSRPSQHDRQLEQLMAEYLHSVDRGATLDRDKLLEEHPQLADDLASFFRNQDAIARLAAPLKAEAALDPTLDAGQTAAVGDSVRVRYFGEYELVEEIARGGMGVVYKAKQSSLSRTVALKMILAGQLASPGDVERFHTEAEAAANLDRPHIVPIYEVGEHEGQHYFTMKLMEGGSLAERLAGPQWPVGSRKRDRWAAETIATVARAVHHAHQRRNLAPRPEAGQHPLRRAEPAVRHRLRPGQASRGDSQPHAVRRDRRYARLHGAGTSRGRKSDDSGRRL